MLTTKTTLLAVAAGLMCLPAAAEAARLTSAPLTLDPSPLQTPGNGEGVREEITCSMHYSGAGNVTGELRMLNDSINGYSNGTSMIGGTGVERVPLGPAYRSYSQTAHRMGPESVQRVVCDFNFPGVDASKFRGLACISYEANHTAVCVPIY